MSNPFLSIIIPCYNEEKTIQKLLSRLIQTPIGVNYEIIIVDDGSEIPISPIVRDFINRAEEFSEKSGISRDVKPINQKNEIFNLKNIRVFKFKSNHGKGAAVRLGIKKSRGRYILIQDADLEYFPEDIPLLVHPILTGKAKCVYGSRFKRFPEGMNKLHYLGNIILTHVTNFLYKSSLTDMETGYKLFPKTIFKINDPMLNVKSFELEPAITLALFKNNMSIFEVPINYKYRIKGRAKIHFGDGIQAILFLLKFKSPFLETFFSPIYYIYSNYINHKLGKIFHLVKKTLRTHFNLK